MAELHPSDWDCDAVYHALTRFTVASGISIHTVTSVAIDLVMARPIVGTRTGPTVIYIYDWRDVGEHCQ